MVKSLPPAVAALQSSIEHIASDLHDLKSTLRDRGAECDTAAEQVTLLQEKVGGHTALLEANAVFQCEILDRLAALEKTSADHAIAFATHDARIVALSEQSRMLDKARRYNSQWQTNNLNHLLMSSYSSACAQNANFNQLDTLVRSLQTRITDLEEVIVVPDASVNLNDGSNLFEEHPSTKLSANASPSSKTSSEGISDNDHVEISLATWDKLTTRVTTLEEAALASDESACIAIKRLSARLRSLEEEVEENKDECKDNKRAAINNLSTRMPNLEKTTEADIKRLDDETAALDANIMILKDAALAGEESACIAFKRLSARINSLKENTEEHKNERNNTRPAAIDVLSARISSLEKTTVASIERLCDQTVTLDATLKSTNDALDSTIARIDEAKSSIVALQDSSNDSQIQDLKARNQDLDAGFQLLSMSLINVKQDVHTNHDRLTTRICALEETNCNERLKSLEIGTFAAGGEHCRLKYRVHGLEGKNYGEQLKSLAAVANAAKEDHGRRISALEGNKYDEQLKSLEAVTGSTKDDHKRFMTCVNALEGKLKAVETDNKATEDRLDACAKAITLGGSIYRSLEKLRGKVEKIEGENCSERMKHFNEELVVRVRALEDQDCHGRIVRLENNPSNRVRASEEDEEGVDYNYSYGYPNGHDSDGSDIAY